MQDVSILGCQGKKAIGKEVLLALEIATAIDVFTKSHFLGIEPSFLNIQKPLPSPLEI